MNHVWIILTDELNPSEGWMGQKVESKKDGSRIKLIIHPFKIDPSGPFQKKWALLVWVLKNIEIFERY